MIIVKNIAFQYEGTPQFKIPNISLQAGDELLVLGKSGSGKTTFLNIMGGLLQPQSGDVFINNTSLYTLKGASLDKFRSENVGIIFQKPHILQPLTVEENIKLANFFSKKSGPQVDTLLQELGILQKKKSKVSDLSEGEAQRVSIARALAVQPKLILADEPTASLDDENAEKVIRLLQDQAKKYGAVLIIVTHDQRIKKHVKNQITMGGDA
jgi:lipoprotein-releasing system ATP-binding protein